MKKFIALLLALVMVLSFAACASEDDDDGERRKSRKSKEATEEAAAESGSYEDAIELVMKLYTADLSKSDFEKMLPADVWTYLEDEEGMTVDDCYGLDADDFGDAYEIEFSATVSGSEGEDTQEMEMGFVEYKGVWYAAEALLEGF